MMAGRSTMWHTETLFLKLTAQKSHIFFETSDDCGEFQMLGYQTTRSLLRSKSL
jgi:hypothetical protein